METQFLNEHALPGKIGELFTILSFAASIVATIAYFLSTQSRSEMDQRNWKNLARSSFFVHTGSVFGIFITLFYIIFNHYFEYNYAWTHSSRELPFKYLLSCFWEGQEGSFLLWTTWNCILSFFVIGKNNKWESPVMSIVGLAQVILASMLLGLYFFGERLMTLRVAMESKESSSSSFRFSNVWRIGSVSNACQAGKADKADMNAVSSEPPRRIQMT